MSHYKKVINNLLPADDLHWSDEENKYVSLSNEETNQIILRCIEQGMDSIDEIHKFMSWCGAVRVGELLWKNYISGHLEVVGFDEKDEPMFAVATKGLD